MKFVEGITLNGNLSSLAPLLRMKYDKWQLRNMAGFSHLQYFHGIMFINIIVIFIK